MGYFIFKVGSSGILDKSLLPVDFQDGTMPAQLLITGPGNAWAFSPIPASAPAIAPIFMLAGDVTRLTAPVVIVQLALGGLGNLHEWRAANGSILARLDNVGKLQSARYTLQVPGVAGPDLALVPVTGGQSVLATWHGLQINALRLGSPDYTPANIGGADDYHVIIPLNQAAKVGLGIRAKAGQTADLQQWQDSAGAVLARISSAGILFGNAAGLTNVPVSAHTHAGSDITSPVANASSADAVPWTGVSGKPGAFPPSAHTHNGTDVLDNTLAGSKLQDGTVTFAKLRTDQNAFTDLTTAAQAINGGAAFAAGIYACRLSVPNGAIAPFTLSVGFRNGSFEFTANNAVAASVAIGGVPGVTFVDFSNMFDGRTYRLTFNTTTGAGTINVTSGVATGQTSLTFRRIV